MERSRSRAERYVAAAISAIVLATLSDAFARELLQTRGLHPVREAGNSVITLSGGFYEVASPFARLFSDVPAGSALVIKGAADGSTRIVGSRLYRPRPPRPDESLPQRLAKDPALLVIDADDDIRRLWREGRETALGCGAATVLALFEDGRRLNCARWPTTGYARADTVLIADPKALSFAAPSGKVEDWRDVPDLSVSGYFGEDWLYETGAVAAVEADGAVRLAPLRQNYQPVPGFRYVVRGAPADLTGPGEYVSDPAGGRIFLKGFADAGAAPEIEIPIARTLLSLVAGVNVTIENIDFSMSWGDAIAIRNSQNVTLRNVRVEHVGGAGIVVEGGRNVAIEDAVVSDIGGVGIALGGGDRRTLEPAGHVARRCVVTNTSVLDRTCQAAVTLDGVGNMLEDCYIADLPHIAVSFSGNDHRIVGNEITRVVAETSDSGAIYAGRDWTWRGTKIEGNYLHDILPAAEPSLVRDGKGRPFPIEVKGVYFDDMLSGNAIEGNIFANVEQPVFIGGGRDNRVLANLFVNPRRQAMFLDARGLSWPGATDPHSTIRQRLEAAPYRAPPYSDRYPGLATILESNPGEPRGDKFADNVIVGGAAFRFADQAEAFAQLGDNASPDGWRIGQGDTLDEIVGALAAMLPANVPAAVRDALIGVGERLRTNRMVWARLQPGLFQTTDPPAGERR